MKKANFEGIYSAIFSVYDENYNIKKDTVKKLVDYHLNSGIKGFYVCGNTGEATTLHAKPRKEMLEAVVEANAGRGKIMAHIGAGHYEETMELLEHANGLEIDAVASLPPALQKFFKEDETVEYYKRLAEKSKHPLYAYVTNALNGDPVRFAEKLSKIDNIAGIKLSIPDYYTFGRIVYNNPNLEILNGPDECMICGLAVGAAGAIGTTYNIVPKLAVSIYDAFKSGNVDLARELQNKMNKVVTTFVGHNKAYWKAGMTLQGFDMGHTVFPTKLVSKEELADLEAKLKAIGFFDMI